MYNSISYQYHLVEWQLILSHIDIRDGLFSSNVRTTFLENEDDPEANTFTDIGNLDEADYVDSDGYYHFLMIYSDVHDYTTASSDPENNITISIEWKQTSWLTASSLMD